MLDREAEEFIDPAKPFYVSLYGDTTKRSGFGRVGLRSAAEHLLYDDARPPRLTPAGGAPVRCHRTVGRKLRAMLRDSGAVVPLRSRERITTGGGVTLQALFTPGHEIYHVCVYARR